MGSAVKWELFFALVSALLWRKRPSPCAALCSPFSSWIPLACSTCTQPKGFCARGALAVPGKAHPPQFVRVGQRTEPRGSPQTQPSFDQQGPAHPSSCWELGRGTRTSALGSLRVTQDHSFCSPQDVPALVGMLLLLSPLQRMFLPHLLKPCVYNRLAKIKMAKKGALVLIKCREKSLGVPSLSR